jgi:hypothetical protein
MKFNPFQKILVLFYIFSLILFFLFFVPFIEEGLDGVRIIVYDSIWESYLSIDFFRFFIFIFLFASFYFIFHRFLYRFNDILIYKRRAKFELYIFFTLVISIVFSLTFFLSINYFNEIKWDYLGFEIKALDTEIQGIKDRSATRCSFLLDCQAIYKLSEYNGDCEKFWEYLVSISSDQRTLNDYYSRLPEWLLRKFNILTTGDFEEFVKHHSLLKSAPTPTELLNEKENLLKQTKSQRAGLIFYEFKVIQKNLGLFLLTYLGIMYFGRFLFYFVKDLFAELK